MATRPVLSCARSRRGPKVSVALLLLLGGCPADSPAAPPEETDTRVTSPTPYEPDLDDVEAGPALTADELSEGLAEVLVYLHGLDPLFQHDGWLTMVETWAESDVCPSIGDHNGQDYWNDDCTTDEGAHFNGWALNFRGGGWDDGTLYVREYDWLSGHAFILGSDGVLLENYGDVELLVAQDQGGYDVFSGFVYGDFSWSDARATDTWLQMAESNETYFQYEDHVEWRSAWLDAAVTYFDGPVLAARLEDVSIDDAVGSCASEPAGRVRLRDREGRWYYADFGASGADDAACDGCAVARMEAWDGGEEAEIGAVCGDFAALVAWQGWPWTP